MHDLRTGNLIEFDSGGGTGAGARFGGRWGYQTAFGQWTGVTSGVLATRASLPAKEASSFFTFLGGIGTGQNAPRVLYRSGGADIAAVDVLRFYNPFSIAKNREFGGSICQVVGGRFFATVPNEGASDQVPPSVCESVVVPNQSVQLRGRYHTHGTYGDRGLSPQDQVNADANPGKAWYVAEPCGGIYKYVGPNGVVNPDGTIGVKLNQRTETLPSISGPQPNCSGQ